MAIRFGNGFGIGASNNGGTSLSFFTNIEAITTYLKGYMSDFRNPDFYEYSLDGDGHYINDGGGDMMDGSNFTTPWLISNTTYTGSTSNTNSYPYSVDYNANGVGTIDTSFGFISLGYSNPTYLPLTVIGTRATIASPGTPIGFQCGGNIGADGGGTFVEGNIYTGDTVSGFTVHSYYRETYDAGDPSVCDVFILIGHPDWNSVFGDVFYGGDSSNQGSGSYLYTTGNGAQNILAIKTLLSKNGGTEVTFSEVNTVVDNFIIRIKQAKESIPTSPTPTPTPTPSSSPTPLSQYTPNGTDGGNGLITYLDRSTGLNASSQIPDQSGFNVDYAYQGSNPYSAGVGYVLGGGNYLYSTSNTVYHQVANSMTIEMWFKLPTIPSSMSLIAAGANSGSGGWALRIDGSGNQLNLVKYNIADQTVNLPSQLQTDTWYHIVVAQGGTSLTYFINGQIVGAVNDAVSNGFSYSSGNVNISKDFYTTTNYGMTMGSLKIYDYCVLSADILTEFNNTKSDYGYVGSTPTPTPTNTQTPTPTPSPSSVLHPYQYQLINDTNVTGAFGNNLSLACQGVDCHLNMTCSAQSYAPFVYFNNQTPSVGDNIYSDNNSNSSISVTDGYYMLNDGYDGYTVVEIVSNQIASIPSCTTPTPTPTSTVTPTPSSSSAPAASPTPTSTVTPTASIAATATPTATPSITPTVTPSSSASASAPMTVTIYESGSNVVMTSTGTVNLSGLTLVNSNFGPIGGGGLGINTATFICGNNGSYASTYSGFTATPSNFGSGSGAAPSSASGDYFGVIMDGQPPYLLLVPTGYTSNTNISGTQTFTGQTLTSLGLTNGTYTYTWSGGSIDVIVGGPAPTPTPSPSTGAVTSGWNFYEASGNVVTVPPQSNGQILIYGGGPPTSTYNPNNGGGGTYILIYKYDSAGTNYTTQFTNLQNNGGTINITQNGNTATYVGSSGAFNFDASGFLVVPTAIQTVTVGSAFTYTDRITLTFS
jgi:hypothetical protein